MKIRRLSLIMMFAAALSSTLSTAQAAADEGEPDREAEMAEDLEVMGRILHAKIDQLYGEGDKLTAWVHHDANWAQITDEQGDTKIAAPLANHLEGYGIIFQMELPGLRPVPVEATQEKPQDKPATLWDQVRGRLRGETSQQRVESQLPQSCLTCHDPGGVPVLSKLPYLNYIFHRQGSLWNTPSREELVDALLKMLAENGHNFRHLAADQRLVIALTIRPWEHPVASASGYLDSAEYRPNQGGSVEFDKSANSAWINLGKPLDNALAAIDAEPAMGAYLATPIGSRLQEAGKHELAGDLHARQGKAEEAIRAYQKALETVTNDAPPTPGKGPTAKTESTGQQALARLHQKIAAAYETDGQPDKAREYLEALIDSQISEDRTMVAEQWRRAYLDWTGLLPPESQSRHSYPARLTVTATKSLLDQAAAGEVTPQQFKSLAHVRYVPPRRRPRVPQN